MSKEFVSCRKLMMFIHSHVSELTSPKNAAQSKCETRVSALYCSCAELCSTRNTILCVKQENGTNERLLSFVPITEISSSYSRTQATMYRVKKECSLCASINFFWSVVNQRSPWEMGATNNFSLRSFWSFFVRFIGEELRFFANTHKFIHIRGVGGDGCLSGRGENVMAVCALTTLVQPLEIQLMLLGPRPNLTKRPHFLYKRYVM